MTNLQLYDHLSEASSKLITKAYSTSFSRSILFLEPEIRRNIYAIYGFVRLADEIVDTFHAFDKKQLLDDFVGSYRKSLAQGISLNPIVHSFCQTQKKYNIPQGLVDSFLDSMYMDLGDMTSLNQQEYQTYIYGSAEVVGLMCLRVFVGGDDRKYEQLKPSAQHLGAALQKVNFLRDVSADYHQLNRTYFPSVDFTSFTQEDKRLIEQDIAHDFEQALKGIKKLPLTSRFAVYLAYRYYTRLFYKICSSQPDVIFERRVRVNNLEKLVLFSKIMVYKQFKLASYLH